MGVETLLKKTRLTDLVQRVHKTNRRRVYVYYKIAYFISNNRKYDTSIFSLNEWLLLQKSSSMETEMLRAACYTI